MDWELEDGTDFDVSDLRNRDAFRSLDDLYREQADAIRKVHLKYLAGRKPTRRMAPFHVTWFKKLHREMFGSTLRSAGTSRQEDKNFGIVWHQIDSQLQQLESNVECWECTIERSAALHLECVRIHPFNDGNGRWARMLTNIWLRRHGHPHIRWHAGMLAKRHPMKDAYYEAIRAGLDGDAANLIELHRANLS